MFKPSPTTVRLLGRYIPAAIAMATATTLAECPALFTSAGDQAAETYGVSVSFTGDLDLDGSDDVVVGTSGYDGDAGKASGRVYVYSSATGDAIATFEGVTSFSLLGTAVDGRGDIDADGTQDLVFGAPGYDGVQSLTGRVHVYSGRTQQPLWTWSGEAPFHHFGWSVSSEGDVNADGHADVVVGAPGFSSSRLPGKAYVLCGATGQLVWQWSGPNSGSHFGFSVDIVGDVDRDGFDDVIVGARWIDGATGGAFVFSGATGESIWADSGEHPGDAFGESVAGLGDLDHDDHADFAVAAEGYPRGLQTGKVTVYSGATGKPLWTATGPSLGSTFGDALCTAGDTNGDGHIDVLIGASFANGEVLTGVGAAFAFSGPTGQLLYGWHGNGFFDLFGRSLAGGSDLDNDDLDDVLIGAPSARNIGEVYALKGRRESDINCSGAIDVADLIAVILSWGDCEVPAAYCEADVTGDGSVDRLDLLKIVLDWSSD